MNINDIYVLIQYIINKNQQGYLSPSQFNEVINQAQRSYISYLLGSFQSYLPGRPVSRVELGQNSVVRQRLSPVIKSTTLGIDMYGVSSYPSDYLQADAMRLVDTFQRVRFVQQDSLYSYYNSVIDPVASNPIYLIKDTGFQFYPTSLSQASLSYIANPQDMLWGYELVNNRPVYSPEKEYQIQPLTLNQWTLDPPFNTINSYTHATGNTNPLILDITPLMGNYYEITFEVYNASSEYVTLSFGGLTTGSVSGSGSGTTYTLKGVVSTNAQFLITPSINFSGYVVLNSIYQYSQQPVWDDLSIFDIIQRALSMIGVNLQSAAISQYAEQIKREGQ